ncbi:Nucleobase-ascorbate transporter [Vigna angularis]|uniref:Nucleobase-ascorbate transporter n=1 Tax=Phaseolus angularis TaxID=3914 RepID=A0A8T0L726_PHAAN|nr:Nucleobase-ascorbate transporter [Vigna angularis]
MVTVIELAGFGLFDRGFPMVGHCVGIGIPRADRANLVSSAPRIKIPYPVEWGAPTFDAGPAFRMLAAVLVSLIEVNA